MRPKRVILAGTPAAIVGNADDVYFINAQTWCDELERLVKYAGGLKPDACIADIGANIGLSAIALARALPKSTIVAFEPSPETFVHLQENLKLNGISNVTPVNSAAGAKRGELRFFYASSFSAGAHVDSGGNITVPVTRIDTYCEANKLRLDFVKMDVEGYEPWVIAGLRNQLERRIPLWLEYNAFCLTGTGAQSLAFARTLVDHFTMLRIEKDGTHTGVEDAYAMWVANVMERGFVDDLLIQLRPGCDVPSLAALVGQTAMDVSERVDAPDFSTSAVAAT